MTNAIYTASATSWGGRTGKVVTSDNKLQLDLSIPKDMGGDDGPYGYERYLRRKTVYLHYDEFGTRAELHP